MNEVIDRGKTSKPLSDVKSDLPIYLELQILGYLGDFRKFFKRILGEIYLGMKKRLLNFRRF